MPSCRGDFAGQCQRPVVQKYSQPRFLGSARTPAAPGGGYPSWGLAARWKRGAFHRNRRDNNARPGVAVAYRKMEVRVLYAFDLIELDGPEISEWNDEA